MEPRGRSPLVGTLLVLAAVSLWGVYFPYAKVVLAKISPVSFLIIRLGVGAATLYALNLALKRSLHIARKDWWFIVLAGLIGIVLHQMIQLAGLRQTSATNTGWILTLNPPVAGLLGWLLLKERASSQKLIGLAIAMAGVALLVSRGHLETLSFVRNWGDTLALISIGTWSIYTIMVKSRLQSYESLAVAALHMLLGFVVFGAIGGASFLNEAKRLTGQEWAIAILIGIFPSGLAYYWWNAGLKRLSVIDISMFLFIEAIVASFAGWWVLGESFTLMMGVGTVIIVAGVLIAQRRLTQRK